MSRTGNTEGVIIMRNPKKVSDRQLHGDTYKLHQRTVRNKKTGKTHKQGVMRGTKYGYRVGSAKIGSKTVYYASGRRGSQ